MRKGLKIAAVVAMVAIMAVAAVGAVAYAQEATTGSSAVWDFGQKVKAAIADALGISVEKYDEIVTTARQQVLEEGVASGQITQEQADRMQQRLDDQGKMGRMGKGQKAGSTSLLMTTAAEKLGMTEADLMAEMQAGKSLADVAAEKGVDTQAISDAYLTALKAELAAQVADGSLTQAEADAKLAAKTEALPDRLTGSWSGRGGDAGHHNRGGTRDSAQDTADAAL